MYRTLVIAAILWVGSAGWVLAADTPGSSDHPFIPRYPGSEIVSYEQEAFNEYGLLTGPVKFQEAEPREKIEGKITYITYDLKADRSSLEVMRNYEKALEENGFEFLYQCKNQDCGGRHFNHAAVEYNLRFGDHYSDQRYLAGKLSRPKEGDVYLSLYMVKWDAKGGTEHPIISIRADIIEIEGMEVGMELKQASEMQKEIAEGGRVAIYGILFDFDKADIKPESQETLMEIAKLLNENTSLELLVVGHTDNQGALQYNLDLSRRRAKAVVTALAGNQGIAASRLEGHGVGYLAPVATNKTEEGRALNRRVELVER